MSVAYNSQIVRSGLVLCLDAGNQKSHSPNRFISSGSGLVTETATLPVRGTNLLVRVAAGTVIGGYTVKATDVVYSYSLGTTECHYHGSDIPIPAGTYATFSFDYLVTGATTYPITDFIASFEIAFSNSIGTANNLQNVWQRRTFTSGPTASAGTLRALLYPGGCFTRLADTGTIYYRNPKVEFTNVDTGPDKFSSMSNLTTWTDLSGNGKNGTMSNVNYNNANGGSLIFNGTSSSVSLSNPLNQSNLTQVWTVSAWIKNTTKSVQTLVGGLNHGLHLDWYNSGSLLYLNSGANDYYTYGNNINNTGWCLMTYRFNNFNGLRTIYKNTTDITLSGPNNNGTPSGQSATFTIGSGSGYMEGNIAQISMYNRYISDDEIKQNFNATRGRFNI